MNQVALDLGVIQIYWYSIFIFLGMLVACILIYRESKKRGIDEDFLVNLAFSTIIIGIIGSIIPIIICIFGYREVTSLMYEKMSFIKNYVEFKDTLSMFLAIAPVTIVLGILLGVIGSVNSIKKHLNV